MFGGILSEKTLKIEIKKNIGEEDVSSLGAFPEGVELSFEVMIPRSLGVVDVTLGICEDGRPAREIPLEFLETSFGEDSYGCTLALCGDCFGVGIYYYEFILSRGENKFFTTTFNNLDAELAESSQGKFRLLVYKKEFDTPSFIKGKTIYHIFVDRFAKGSVQTPVRDDAVMIDDWDGGIPEYPEERGMKYPNNSFFGGDLFGVADKLEYLKELGVGVIYLSPIFKAYSNHKYDTGNYLEIDSMFGGQEAFKALLKKADRMGIRVILDGVFNHTGDDSLYFDKYGRYGGVGAYSDPDSVYRGWYNFKRYPVEYESWWGIDVMPRLNHGDKGCRDFFLGKDGVVRKYLREGISGWRLDVADELSNEFLEELREAAKSERDDSLIIGEVWENAADKMAYGVRKHYFLGSQLDSVMNYPLRTAVIDYMRYGDAAILADTLKELYASYPRCVCHSLMNILSTHDTERILTVLGVVADDRLSGENYSNRELAAMKMPPEVRKKAKVLLRMAAVIQYTSFGVPSLFYGDEAGVEGYHDPFCRRPYPWGNEDGELLGFYKLLGRIRSENKEFSDGDFFCERAEDGFIAYRRGENIIVCVNRSESEAVYDPDGDYRDLLTGEKFSGIIKGDSALILKKTEV